MSRLKGLSLVDDIPPDGGVVFAVTEHDIDTAKDARRYC
jgi:hypothetical protein